ncbi:MAG: aminoacyl-tRNA hydrolase [Acidobacteriota bacterium]
MGISAVVGLGNPGERYRDTRHNLGYRVVDLLASRLRARNWQHQYHSLLARRSGGSPLLLVKPQTFMNCSGDALAALCRGEGFAPEECLVVVDDVELPLGQLRLRPAGGSGSHNGLRSLVEAVGEGFPRLRLGIRGEDPWDDLADYVLTHFAADELAAVDAMVGRAADCAEMVVRVGLSRAATAYNSPLPPPE